MKTVFVCCHHSDKNEYDWLLSNFGKIKIPKKIEAAYKLADIKFTLMTPSVKTTDISPQDTLVVICSIKSAHKTSDDINSQILTFKQRSKNVLAIIVDGEPSDNADSNENCFPKALMFKVDEYGQYLNDLEEPIAADVRPKTGSRKDAILKLQAGILGIKYRDLKGRETERKRKKRIKIILIFILILFLVAILTYNQTKHLFTPQLSEVEIDKAVIEKIKNIKEELVLIQKPDKIKINQLIQRAASLEGINYAGQKIYFDEFISIKNGIHEMPGLSLEKIKLIDYLAGISFYSFNLKEAEKLYIYNLENLALFNESSKNLDKIRRETEVNLLICQLAFKKYNTNKIKELLESANKSLTGFNNNMNENLEQIFDQNLFKLSEAQYQQWLEIFNDYIDQVIIYQDSEFYYSKNLFEKSTVLYNYRKKDVARSAYELGMKYLEKGIDKNPAKNLNSVKSDYLSLQAFEYFVEHYEYEKEKIFKTIENRK